MLHLCSLWLFIAVFGVKRVASFSLRSNSAVGELACPKELLGFDKNAFAVPPFETGLYRSYAKHGGNVKRNSKRIAATVHCFVGQATPGSNGIFFNLNVSNIRNNKSILSARIRVMVKTIGRPQPPLPSNGNLILYDQLDRRPLQSVTVKGGGAKLVVFPVLGLVKRWIHSPRLNHGVYIRLHSNHLQDEESLKVKIDSTGEAKDDRPLLVVETKSKPQKVDTMPFWTRQMANLKAKSRHRRSIRDEGPCSRRPMKIEFEKDIHWKGIVFPKFYEAYRCGGDCRFPLESKVNPTNHAIIRALLYSAGLDQGSGKPCCVPIKLKGISTIENHDNRRSVKFYKKMVVEECGCR